MTVQIKKEMLAKWQSRGGKYYVELFAEYLDGCAPAFSYKTDNGGGYMGHCAPEVAMQRAAQEAGYAPSKMPRTFYNSALAKLVCELHNA